MLNKNFAVFMGVVALAIVTGAVMLRYDTTAPNHQGTYIKTDRWTGTTWRCTPTFVVDRVVSRCLEAD